MTLLSAFSFTLYVAFLRQFAIHLNDKKASTDARGLFRCCVLVLVLYLTVLFFNVSMDNHRPFRWAAGVLTFLSYVYSLMITIWYVRTVSKIQLAILRVL